MIIYGLIIYSQIIKKLLDIGIRKSNIICKYNQFHITYGNNKNEKTLVFLGSGDTNVIK